MAKPTLPGLLINDFVNTQVPPEKNCTTFDITMRYVLHDPESDYVEHIIHSWIEAQKAFGSWQGQVIDIKKTDQSVLPHPSPEWKDFVPYVSGIRTVQNMG